MENRNIYAGIDTSNYSTSAAVYHACNNNIVHDRLLLPVKKGNIGLRQSDAVFLHTKQLPQVLGPLISETEKIDAVGVSIRPRDLEGSYMPCFLVGKLAASVISDSLHIPLFTFSHQSGHIMAALYSSSSLNLIHHEFIAFHISGGTTECIVVSPDEDTVFKVHIIGGTSDLNAGQAVDRIGALLGLDFPAGPQLEKLAMLSSESFKIKPHFKNGRCSFSGLENICSDMKEKGTPDCDIAAYCIEYITTSVSLMTEYALSLYSAFPVVFSGGVMSNRMIQKRISEHFEAHFAEPVYSSDNAAGIALLTAVKHNRRIFDDLYAG